MSLIDGRYEVIAEQVLGGGRTLFSATAPDGTPLRIEWFDLPPDRESEFERYRRLLKQLKRQELAAIHDVVARPGANYVAWLTPPDGATDAHDAELAAVLAENGYAPSAAHVLKAGGRGARPCLYGLSFGDAALPPAHTTPSEQTAARPLRHVNEPRLRWLTTLSVPALSWLLSGFLLLVAVGLLVGAVGRQAVNDLVVVPDLVGAEAQSAADTLTGLKLAVVPVALASDQPAGTVLALEPAAGSELRPGRSVQLSYALPPGRAAPTEVPELVGLVYPGPASDALAAAGLRVGHVARVHAPQPAGTVLSQSAGVGGRVGSGEAVSLVVSLGPSQAQTFLPQLVGLHVDEARALAQVAGFSPERVLVDEVAATRGFAGQVLSQSLAAYVPVAADDAVLRLVVQSGTVGGQAGGAPDLVGLPLSQAMALASAWNVTVNQMANLGLPGGVVAQDPPPGEIGADATLTLLVNTHPVAIPTDGIRAVVQPPRLREVGYAWAILLGIPPRTAEVWATDVEGRRTLVERVQVEGGQILEGTWLTVTPGPITFELYLAGVPYGDPIRRQ